MQFKKLFKKCSMHMLLILFITVFNISFLHSQTPVEKHGQLRVQGNRIVDKNSQAVQLRGMSFFWSQWIGKYYTYNTVKWLRDDWCCSVVRAAMAVDNDGYATNPEAEKEKVYTVIDAAIQLGIYVVVDFHVHDAHLYKNEAKTFFAEVAQRYGNAPNIIYEIWNEPLDVSWSNVIKPYHNEIIPVIRQIDSDNIIVCGTRLWSQRVDEAANDPVTGTNIAYTLHYYANTHGQYYRDLCSQALSKNVPVFVTEYGTCSADGGGNVNVTESNNWWSYLNQNSISHCNWSIADKVETASAIRPNASINGNWSASELTASGTLVRNHLKSRCDFTIPKNIVTSITSPANNSSFNLGTSVTLTATGTTTVGTLTKIEFYVNDVIVHTATAAPYTFELSNLGIGKHKVYAIAFNSQGESTNTSVIDIEILTPIYRTTIAPVIDGSIDAVWTNANIPTNEFTHLVSGAIANEADLSGNFKVLWDPTYLYVLGDVSDDVKINDSPEIYNDDAVELYVDINNNKPTTYGANDVQYSFGWDDGVLISTNPSNRATTNISYSMVSKTGGYIFEARIPWTTLQGSPVVGQKVGLDFMVNDDDDGDERDGKISWNAIVDEAWQNPSLFGTAILQDLVPCNVPMGVGHITGDTAVCKGDSNITYVSPVLSNASRYDWALPSGWAISSYSNDSSSISVHIPSDATSGTLKVVPSNECGNGTALTLNVEVSAVPAVVVVKALTSTTFCEGESVVLSTDTNDQLSYVWRNGSNQVGTTSSFTAVISGGYTVQVTDLINTCMATSLVVPVTVHSKPMVEITSPVTSSFTAPFTFPFSASVQSNEVSRVQFYNNQTLITEDMSSPYVTTLENLPIGNYELMAIAITASGCADTATRRIGVVTSLHQNFIEEQVSVYPNPSQDQIFVELDGDFQYKVFSTTGVEIRNGFANGTLTLGSEMPQGVYILKIIKQDRIHLVKLEKY